MKLCAAWFLCIIVAIGEEARRKESWRTTEEQRRWKESSRGSGNGDCKPAGADGSLRDCATKPGELARGLEVWADVPCRFPRTEK